MKTRVITGLALATLLGLAACQPRNPELVACPQIADDYFRTHTRRDARDLLSFDLATQYQIYICGQQFMMPAHLELAEAFASQGEATIPFLTAKLRDGVSDRSFSDIVWLFLEMSRQGTYRVSENTVLLELIRARSARVLNPRIKSNVEKWMLDIERSDAAFTDANESNEP